jgi:hypothetical protein
MEIGWADVGSGGYIFVSCAHSNFFYLGELGRYPLFIEIIVSMFSYLTRLSNSKDILLSEAHFS